MRILGFFFLTVMEVEELADSLVHGVVFAHGGLVVVWRLIIFYTFIRYLLQMLLYIISAYLIQNSFPK